MQFSVRNTKATSAANRSGIQSGWRGLSGRGGARAQELEAKSRRVAIQHAWPPFCYVWKTPASVDRSLHPEILLLILMTVPNFLSGGDALSLWVDCFLVYLMPIPLLVIINWMDTGWDGDREGMGRGDNWTNFCVIVLYYICSGLPSLPIQHLYLYLSITTTTTIIITTSSVSNRNWRKRILPLLPTLLPTTTTEYYYYSPVQIHGPDMISAHKQSDPSLLSVIILLPWP